MPAPSPLTLPELAAALDAIGGFEARPLVAVAVSGGPDSMALLLLAERWGRLRGGRTWGLIVDHGLRPESAREARTVAGWLAGRGIPHAVLAWVGGKPESGVQEAAREARYRLLSEWCRGNGVLHLLTAHHRDDQIETHLIRRRAGSGVDGLAGMAAVRELPGCRLVRPVLGVPRERLAAVVAAEGQPVVRDPSNLDPAYERARLRLSFSNRTCERTALDAAAREARACGMLRIAREAAIGTLAARAAALHPAGFAVLDAPPVAAADPELAERLLSHLAACIGGGRYPARRARLQHLRAGLVCEPSRARTLGGCRFVPWRGRILVLRELAAAEAPAVLMPGSSLLWDRRFAVALPADAPGNLTVGYLGQSVAARPEGGFARVLPPLVHAVLPAFWDERGLAAVPHLGYCRPGPAGVPQIWIRPARALTQAGFTVV